MSSCIVITYPFPLRGDTGGGTRSCLQIAEHLDKLGVKVFLVPVTREANHILPDSNVDIISVPESRIHYLIDGLAIAKTVPAILDQNKADAVLSWGHEAAYLTRLLRSRHIVFGIIKIAGWGEFEAVKQVTQELGISENIIYVGCLEPNELVRELERADLAILPSRAESFGRAISEAQAAGLPVVSYNAGSVPEIVEPNVTGCLAPLEQTNLLADGILDAMKDPERTFRMGMAGRDRMQQRFSWEKTAEAILKGIEQVKQRPFCNR
jgi:glycosyltransferase involved in cell wall biosynthesis